MRFIPQIISLDGIIILYWGMFWTLNGLDKFLVGFNIGTMVWYGKDRIDQLGTYMSMLNLPESWATPILYVLGAWEVNIAIVFVIAGICLAWERLSTFHDMARYGLFLAGITFVGFSAFDVITGDRFELMEHGIYFGSVILSWLAVVYWGDHHEKMYRR